MGFCGSQKEGFGVTDAAALGAHGKGHSGRGADPAGAKPINKPVLA